MVYVLHQDGSPLMPTNSAKARHLLENGKAKVVNLEPFIIQLAVPSGKHTQTIIVGLDPGANVAGIAATSLGKTLYQGEISLRTDIHKRMETRAMHRRNRRTRKCRYRSPRFDNRAASRRKGRLPPSVQSRSDTVIKAIKRIASFLPVSLIRVEVANFDIQAIQADRKLHNWAYQRGEQYGFENVKMYVRARDKYTCQYCGEIMPARLEVDHIIPKGRGGATIPSNLIAACHDCNAKKGNMTAEEFGFPDIQGRIKRSLRAAAHTMAGKAATLQGLAKIAPIRETYGYITKVDREKIGLPKTHYFDALTIASDGESVKPLDQYEKMRAVSRGQRQQFKANPSKGHVFKSCRMPYEVFGFRLWDKVRLPDGAIGFVGARRKTGSFTIKDVSGKVLRSISYRKLTLVNRSSTLISRILPIHRIRFCTLKVDGGEKHDEEKDPK